MSAKLLRWSDLPTDSPMDLLSRQRIIGERAMLSRITLKRGCFVPTHAHENEQFAFTISGKLRFIIGAEDSEDRREIIAAAGEVVYLPSNVPHSAEALEDSVVLDVFSPSSATTGIDQGRS
jgi:quercetin dioxygenase-like cupin family protein